MCIVGSYNNLLYDVFSPFPYCVACDSYETIRYVNEDECICINCNTADVSAVMELADDPE